MEQIKNTDKHSLNIPKNKKLRELFSFIFVHFAN